MVTKYMLLMLAANGVPTNEWLPILTAIANIGFSVVVAWYLLARAIPEMQLRFSGDLLANRESAEKVMAEQRDDFHKTLMEQREAFNTTLVRERESTKEMLIMIQKSETEIMRRNAEKLDKILNLIEDYVRVRNGGPEPKVIRGSRPGA